MAIITTSRNLLAHVATSTSSIDTSIGTKNLTIETSKGFVAGDTLCLRANAAAVPTRIRGTVTSYDTATGALVLAAATQHVETDIYSMSTLTIGTGARTLTIFPGLALVPGNSVRISMTTNTGRFMIGTVTTYDNITGVLVVNVTSIASSGTFSEWLVTSEGTFSDWTVTYQQGDQLEIRNGATLTINQNPVTRPGTILCITSGKLRIENFSTTVPLIVDLHDMVHDLRFEAGGIIEIRGAPMSLGAGTGASQTWDFTTLFGGVIRHMTYVEVEETAGSGIYMPWQIIDEDPKFNLDVDVGNFVGGATPAAFSAGNTLAGQAFFWHETNRTLRTGDNTNGRAVPTGCNIRIPNIYISNRLLTNSTFAFNIQTSGTPTGGGFQIEIRSENNSTLIGTTASIPFNATTAQVDTAIEAVTGVGTVTPGSGPLPAALSVSWTGIYANIRPCVRIVNSTLTGGTNPQAYIYENNGSSLSLIDLSPLGTFDAEWVSFSNKFRFVTDTFKSARFVCVGFGADAWQANTSNGSIEIDGLIAGKSPFTSGTTSQIASVFGNVSIQRLVSSSKNSNVFNISTTPALSKVDRLTAGFYGLKGTSSSTRALTITTIPANLKLTNITTIGAGATYTNLTNCTIVGIRHADAPTTVQQSTVGLASIFTTNCVNCTFADYAAAGPSAPRGTIFQSDSSSSNIKLLGATADAGNNTTGITLMQCGNMELVNASLSNIRSGAFIDLPSSYLAINLIAKKVFGTFATAQSTAGLDACQGGQYDMVTSGIAGITETFSGVNDFVGGNYTDPGLTPTTGHVTFGPFGAGVGLELTGSAFTDALGAFLLPTVGDTAVITMPFAMHGITSFQNVEPYLYIDSPGAAANVLIAQAPGIPTGGTFTLSFYTPLGVLIGTTAAIAYNSSASTTSAAVSTVLGLGNHTTSGTSIGGGYAVTLNLGIYSGQSLIMTVDGSLLTGGTEPGLAYAYGRARLLNGTERIGSTTPVEFAIRVPGTTWPAYTSLTGANLQTAFSALTSYNAGGTGLEMRLRVTATQDNRYTKFNQISIPTNVDPSSWVVGDATITLQGPNPTDVIRIVRASDLTVLYSFTGAGVKEFTVGNNFDVEVFFRRESSDGTVLMRTLPATQKINFGNNDIVPLFYGSEVQLAQSADVSAIKTLVDNYLDAAISTRAKETSANIINEGVKKASLLIPHSTNLT